MNVFDFSFDVPFKLTLTVMLNNVMARKLVKTFACENSPVPILYNLVGVVQPALF